MLFLSPTMKLNDDDAFNEEKGSMTNLLNKL